MRGVLGVVVALSLLVLTGCEPEPVYRASPKPTFASFFPSEEDALSAVDAFMQKYTAAASQMILTKGVDQAALEDLVTPEQLVEERGALTQQAEQGLTPFGEIGYFNLEIQQFHQDSATEAFIQAYVCIDFRNSYYLRADGSRFEGQVDWYPYEAIMYASTPEALILHELRRWTGRDFCAPR